jgi:protein-tyrosine phosphatase
LIDLHSHILPGIDDGARSLEEALELAATCAADGIEAIAATPHVRYDFPTTAERMEAGVAELRKELAAVSISVDVLTGAEVELARVWQIPPDELARLTLAGSGRYLLIEFPYRGWPTGLRSTIAFLRELGLVAVLAHPERNPVVQDRPHVLGEAIEAGALVQLTALSIEGRLGVVSRSAAAQLVELGFVHLLGSDAHGPHVRGAGLAAAAEAIGNEALAHYLTCDAPRAVVAGMPLPPRPPARGRTASASGPLRGPWR